jgi:release factor glutamine methyltransferase
VGDRAVSTRVAARDAIAAATDALTAAGCDTPRLDAELLIADSMGLDRARLAIEPDLPLDASASRLAMERVRRRVLREPVAYILGRKGFRGLELAVDRRALIPRPETELLVELAAELAPAGGSVHDVGTGCGAVALALKDERPDLVVSGSDRSAAAVDLARQNAALLGLGVAFVVAAGLPAEAAEVDLVVANLPYVRVDEWTGLEPEIIRHEPGEALIGGPDGLDAISELVGEAPTGALLALEHAPAQAHAVRALLRDATTRRDLSGRERVTIGLSP